LRNELWKPELDSRGSKLGHMADFCGDGDEP